LTIRRMIANGCMLAGFAALGAAAALSSDLDAIRFTVGLAVGAAVLFWVSGVVDGSWGQGN